MGTANQKHQKIMFQYLTYHLRTLSTKIDEIRPKNPLSFWSVKKSMSREKCAQLSCAKTRHHSCRTIYLNTLIYLKSRCDPKWTKSRDHSFIFGPSYTTMYPKGKKLRLGLRITTNVDFRLLFVVSQKPLATPMYLHHTTHHHTHPVSHHVFLFFKKKYFFFFSSST